MKQADPAGMIDLKTTLNLVNNEHRILGCIVGLEHDWRMIADLDVWMVKKTCSGCCK